MDMKIFGEKEMDEHAKKALEGLQAGMEIDFKRVLAGEADKDADIRNDLAYLNKMMVFNGGRIMNAGAAAAEAFSLEMTARYQDTGLARYRKEVKAELRDEELEEQRLISQNAAVEQVSGVNAEMQSINTVIAHAIGEAVAGAMQELLAAGVMKVVSSVESPKTT
jgi:hypothetical protein